MLHKANPAPVPLYPSDKPMTVPLSTPASAPNSTSGSTASPTVSVSTPQPIILPTENWAGTLPPSAPLPPAVPRPPAPTSFLGNKS